MEHLFIRKDGDSLWADGLAVGIHANTSYRVTYMIRFSRDWKVRQVRLGIGGRVNSTVDKFINEEGRWTAFFQEEAADLAGCFAVEISTSPATRSLVLYQLTLSPGETVEIKIASFDVLDLKLRPITHRYTCLQAEGKGGLFRYENLSSGEKEDFRLDREGLLGDSSDTLKRIWTG